VSRLAQLAFVIKELGIRASEVLSDGDDGLEARVRIQKVVYFLKRLGFDIGYEFDLYYNGQASPFRAGFSGYTWPLNNYTALMHYLKERGKVYGYFTHPICR